MIAKDLASESNQQRVIELAPELFAALEEQVLSGTATEECQPAESPDLINRWVH